MVARRDSDHPNNAVGTDAVTLEKKKTYKQNWPAYNRAQTEEKHRFQALLFDLCKMLPPDAKVPGRPRIPMRDVVFATTFKVYSTLSSRRFMCDMKDAFAKGYMSRISHYNSVNAQLESERLTPVLEVLIQLSAVPLRAVETKFAVDSTGFSTSRFIRWFDEKYGVERSGHDWVKVHIMSGVKTNIITAVEIRGRDANDAPLFRPLVATTRQAFQIEEVSADKAYSSVKNVEAVYEADATPLIPFKLDASGARGGLWERALLYYQLHREEFLARYHQRSNVESTFSMIKAKFRDHVRSRSDVAMKNEVLCKLLAHNLVVLIQSQIELGIEPVFWGETATTAVGRAS
jgi:transposase